MKAAHTFCFRQTFGDNAAEPLDKLQMPLFARKMRFLLLSFGGPAWAGEIQPVVDFRQWLFAEVPRFLGRCGRFGRRKKRQLFARFPAFQENERKPRQEITAGYWLLHTTIPARGILYTVCFQPAHSRARGVAQRGLPIGGYRPGMARQYTGQR